MSPAPVLAAPVLKLVAAVFDLIGDERAKNYFKKATECELELERELRKDYDQRDDAKIVALKHDGAILEDAALREYELWKSRKKG